MGRLVITRKHGQRVLLRGPLGEETWITVQEDNKGRVRLIFDAPADVQILRAELLEKGKRDGQAPEGVDHLATLRGHDRGLGGPAGGAAEAGGEPDLEDGLPRGAVDPCGHDHGRVG